MNTPADPLEPIGGLTVPDESGSANSPVASDELFPLQPSPLRPVALHPFGDLLLSVAPSDGATLAPAPFVNLSPPPFSLFDHLGTVLAVKGSLRRAE